MDNVKQNVLEYYEALQIEYLIAEVRKKIYPSKFDKKYYGRIMELKKEKIIDISLKNSLPSIFDIDSNKVLLSFIAKVYNVKGMPNFGKYLKEQDVDNYYLKDSLVKVYRDLSADSSDFVSAFIVSTTPKSVIVRFDDGKTETISKNLVTRIL